MKAKYGLLLATSLLVGATACQNTEQSSVQPEKLASSTSSVASTPPAGSGGPLIPYANGYGPKDLAPEASASAKTASNDPGEEFNPDGVAPAPTAKKLPAFVHPTPRCSEGLRCRRGGEPDVGETYSPCVTNRRSFP